VIDRQGIIRYKRIGPVSVDILQEKILPLVRELQG
jgi:cytochrome c biogenesis protein CcmG/thiol:disulfide interchange protein DsbE